jgi:hypothetical protein
MLRRESSNREAPLHALPCARRERGEAGAGCALRAAPWGLYIGCRLEQFSSRRRGGTKRKGKKAAALGWSWPGRACVLGHGGGSWLGAGVVRPWPIRPGGLGKLGRGELGRASGQGGWAAAGVGPHGRPRPLFFFRNKIGNTLWGFKNN